ncbi:MAG: ubiquinol-cytochrome C chaperone family protein, partial [Marinomonas sp.]
KWLGLEADPVEKMRPLWHKVVGIARDPSWYAQCKVADSVDGRFDMITGVLCVTLVRLEASDALRGESAFLTELFVEDMDGQLREFGVNDVVVGKRMGKLMSVVGGRLGAYRPALNSRDLEKLLGAIERNVSFAEGGSPEMVRDKLLALADILAALDDDAVIAADAVALPGMQA